MMARGGLSERGSAIEVENGVVLRPGSRGHAGQSPEIIQTVVQLGRCGVLSKRVVGFGVLVNAVIVWFAIDRGHGIEATALLGAGKGQQQIHVIGRQDKELAADVGRAQLVGVHVQEFIFDVAIGGLIVDCQTASDEAVDQGAVGHGRGTTLSVLASIAPHRKLGIEGRILAFHDDGTSQRVTPLGGRLGATVDLHLLHVPKQHRVVSEQAIDLQGVVDIDRDRAIHGSRALIIETADRNPANSPVLITRLSVDTWSAVQDILEILIAMSSNVFAGHHGNTGQCLVLAALDLFSSNHHFLQLQRLLCTGFFSCHRGSHSHQTGRDSQCQRVLLEYDHRALVLMGLIWFLKAATTCSNLPQSRQSAGIQIAIIST
ncbi:Uncharacterised protein [Ectopseudomonas mendocina]|nr:Uncharacterised protein [Pseudomonas mendocina]